MYAQRSANGRACIFSLLLSPGVSLYPVEALIFKLQRMIPVPLRSGDVRDTIRCDRGGGARMMSYLYSIATLMLADDKCYRTRERTPDVLASPAVCVCMMVNGAVCILTVCTPIAVCVHTVGVAAALVRVCIGAPFQLCGLLRGGSSPFAR